MALHSALTGADLHEIKGADVAAAGQIIIADGLGGAIFSANQVDFRGLIAFDSTTQTAPAPATKKAITLDTQSIKIGVSHTIGGSEVTADTAGIYSLLVIPQFVTGGGGAGDMEVSWEVNTGTGFVTIAGSPVVGKMAATDVQVIDCEVYVTLAVGDIVRAMWATDSTAVDIKPVTSLVGDIVPSVQAYLTHHGA